MIDLPSSLSNLFFSLTTGCGGYSSQLFSCLKSEVDLSKSHIMLSEHVHKRRAEAKPVRGLAPSIGVCTVICFAAMYHPLMNQNARTSVSRQLNSSCTRAVLHMGIHKTGSTTIQSLSAQFIEQLERDGYEMPWSSLPTAAQNQLGVRANQVRFATCFADPTVAVQYPQYPCAPELLASGLDIATRNKNLFVTTEAFVAMDQAGLKSLSVYLSRWDHTTIIIFYRRYYDWLISFYGQLSKSFLLNRQFSEKDFASTGNLVEFIQEATQNTHSKYRSWHSTNLVENLTEYFSDIVVLDYHDEEPSLPECFYCDAIPEIWHNTCQALRATANATTLHLNAAIDLRFRRLVRGAIDTELLKLDPRDRHIFESMCNSVKDYFEQTLDANEDFLLKRCLPPEDMQLLLEISIESELRIASHLSSKKKKTKMTIVHSIEEDFSRRAASGAFCEMDVNESLKLLQWKSFFESRMSE